MNDYAEYMVWGYPLMIHFFLVGVGGGALAISSFLLLRGRSTYLRSGRPSAFFSVARYGALVAPFAVVDDGFVLIAELGHPERFLNILRNVNFWSPMWVGTWLISVFIVVSLVYAYTFLALPAKAGLLKHIMTGFGVSENVGPGDRWDPVRRTMAWIGVPLGIALCLYPGFMLSTLQARPFWNTALLPLVFMFSGVATALAVIVLCRILFKKASDPVDVREYRENNYLLTTTNVVVLSGETLVVLLFVLFAQVTGGSFAHAIEAVLLAGGVLTIEFWLGVVGVGLVVPIVVGLVLVIPRLAYAREYAASRGLEAILPATVLIGGFMLSYVVLIGGQITHPIGL